MVGESDTPVDGALQRRKQSADTDAKSETTTAEGALHCRDCAHVLGGRLILDDFL